MEDFIPNPLKNFKPRINPPKVHLDASRKIAQGLSDEELRTMAREKLSELLQAIDARTAPSLLLSVVREVLDRLEGRPTQRIEQKVEHSSKGMVGEMTNEQLLAALRKADAAGLLPAGTKLLGDGTVVTDAEFKDVTPST